MNAASIDIKDMLLEESSFGFIFGEDLHIGKEPTSPNICVTLFDTSGFAPAMTLDSQSYYYSSIQIRIRHTDYDLGMDLSILIMDTLHGRAQETWNGTLYSTIIAMGEPVLLDWDDNGNARFVINFNMQRRAA